MPRALLIILPALILMSCGSSRKVTKPLTIPAPPAQALAECSIPPVTCGTSECVAIALIERGAAIRACEAKRRSLVEAWNGLINPRAPKPSRP
jgi:hypothetical protein